MTQQINLNHGHPDGDLLTSIRAYELFLYTRRHFTRTYNEWNVAWNREWNACTKVGLMHHAMNAIHESVLVLKKVYSDHKEAFPQVPKRRFGSPGYSTLQLSDRCMIKLPTGEYISPQYSGSWTLDSSSPVHYPTTVIALNRTTRDATSYAS